MSDDKRNPIWLFLLGGLLFFAGMFFWYAILTFYTQTQPTDVGDEKSIKYKDVLITGEMEDYPCPIENRREVSCDCHEWGCAMYCFVCEEQPPQPQHDFITVEIPKGCRSGSYHCNDYVCDYNCNTEPQHVEVEEPECLEIEDLNSICKRGGRVIKEEWHSKQLYGSQTEYYSVKGEGFVNNFGVGCCIEIISRWGDVAEYCGWDDSFEKECLCYSNDETCNKDYGGDNDG